ncbi:MAG: NADH-quinone oxidoreductase subunit M [Chitinophagales bacterium]|nr:NADH-quinone oxidoreductase subunit M [Chitinophagales bacterium]
MLIPILIILPLVAALVIGFLNGTAARVIALAVGLVELALVVLALTQYQYTADAQYVFTAPWVPSLGIQFKVGMDGISLLLVLLTTVLMPLIVLSGFGKAFKNQSLLFALIMAMEAGLIGVFTAMDAFLFYIFWEVALIPIYFICLLWGGTERVRVTLKFFIYTLAGSLLMLVAFIYLYFHTPEPHTFDLSVFASLNLDEGVQGYLFLAFFLAFAIKMALFPFHTWQPDTYSEAPTQGTMILSALMSKMGIYAVLRILLPLAPQALADYGHAAILVAVIGIVYASLVALSQQDWKRLIAYSSIAHIGLMAAGIFTLNQQALQGSVVQMVSHGITAVGLFFLVDILESRTGTRDIKSMSGVRLVAPAIAAYLLIMVLANIALPLTNGFVGEFLLLSGVFQYHPWIAAVAGTGTILGAWYMLSAYQYSILGDKTAVTVGIADLNLREKLVLVPIVILVFGIGVYPQPILDIAAPAVEHLLQMVVK